MTGARRDARFRLYVHYLGHPQPMGEVDSVLVIGNDAQTLQGSRFLFPAPDGLLPAGMKVLAACSEIRSVGGIDLLQPLRHDRRDFGDIVRVELDVRIAGGMDVSFSAIPPRWNFQPGPA